MGPDYFESADDLIDAAETGDDDLYDVQLPSGRIVVIRGLTRDEHLWIGKGTEDAAEIEARLLSKGMVKPVLTIGQARAWQKKAGTKTVSAVSDAIRDLSGFGRDAAKSSVVEAGD